jgi:hypothetical protein
LVRVVLSFLSVAGDKQSSSDKEDQNSGEDGDYKEGQEVDDEELDFDVFPEQTNVSMTTGAADSSAFSDLTAAPVTKAADIVDSSATAAAGLTSEKTEPDVILSSGEPGAVSKSSPVDAVESHNSMARAVETVVEDRDMEGVEESTSPQVGGFLKRNNLTD